MASNQGQVMLRRQAVTTTKPALNQKQSVETVQVMIYSSISMLCRMRNIFHCSAYENAEFAEDDDLYTFDDLLNGNCPPRNQAGSPSSAATRQSEPNVLTVPLLKKNKSERVNLCLGMLETVFEALHRKALHSLRIGFVSNPQTAQDLLELYTFGIRYRNPESSDREVDGLQYQYMGEDAYAQGLDIQGCILNLLGRLYDLCRDMPSLPDDRYMTASIRYIEDGWDPKDFTKTLEPEATVSGFKGWQSHITDLGLSNGIFHDVSLRVAFLKHESRTRRISQDLAPINQNHLQEDRSAPEPESRHKPTSSAQESQPTTPHDRVRSPFSEIPETPMRAPKARLPSKNPQIESKRNTYTDNSSRPQPADPELGLPRLSGSRQASSEALEVPDKPEAQTEKQVTKVVNRLQIRIGSSQPSASQAAEDARVKNALHDMLEPSMDGDGDFVTQQRANPDETFNGEDTSVELAEHMAAYGFLSRQKALQLWQIRHELQRVQSPPEDMIGKALDCQCQRQDVLDPGSMIQCSICGMYQHLTCQGFLDNDTRQPTLHVCYGCLSRKEPDRPGLTKELQELALRRRAMHLILDEQVGSDVALAQGLGLSPDSLAALLERLGSEGYIVESNRRRTRSSQDRLTIPLSVSSKEYLARLERLFDPHGIIEHHFSGSAKPEHSSSDMQEMIMARYPALSQVSSKAAGKPSSARKRAVSETAGSGKQSSSSSASPKRARTSQPKASTAASEQVLTPRRSQRVVKVTPKMRESTFNFLINGRSLPSRGNSATKSIHLKRN